MRKSSERAVPLPAAVVELAKRLGVGQGAGHRVLLRQRGTMRGTPTGREMKFRAIQFIDVHRPQFEWRARTGLFGAISVTDSLRDEEGMLEVRAFGLVRIAHESGGAQLARGEIMRYLAEIAWAPDAILRNPDLAWIAINEAKLSVACGVGSAHAKVELTLDADGRIETVFAPDRPRKEGAGFVERPWKGRFFDYRRHEGRWLPFGGEVGWTIGTTEFTAWRGELTGWSLRS